jgi:hypothetical protein
MFNDEIDYNNEYTLPAQGDYVNHKVYGQCKVWSVDAQSLTAEVFQVGAHLSTPFEINLTDCE